MMTFLDRNDGIRSPRRRRALSRLVLVAIMGLVGAAAFGGYQFYSGGEADETVQPDLTHLVQRDDFFMEVVERGEVESAGSEEIRCEVEGRKTNSGGIAILEIVPEGKEVKEGDFLVRLDSSALDVELTQQKISVTTSEAVAVQAKNAYETAIIAKKEYLEGTLKQEQQSIQSEIFVAEENLRRAKEYLGYSRRLAEKGYVTSLQLEADQFAVDKAKNELEAAQTKLDVLMEFTKAKQVKQLESDIVSTKAAWEAETERYELEKKELAEIQDLVNKCVIYAPKAGQVKYAHRRDSRGNSDFVVEEGAMLREGQVIIRLPDPTQMEVKITVNESAIDMVHENMACSVRRVGNQDVVYSGIVDRVNRYAEPSSWRSANIKTYAAWVRIDDANSELREGMTAEVTIHSQSLPDQIQVPVQAIYGHGPRFYCFVKDGRGWEAMPVEVGPANGEFAVIESGLVENTVVALNPRKHEADVNLPDLPADKLQQVVPPGPRAAGQGFTTTANETGAAAPPKERRGKPGERPQRPS
ncbi:MAG: hypothetical protein KDA42_14190 [Planctomycetales bacterium]|nr:hypothetical protein [Planctomycetales bacterium]